MLLGQRKFKDGNSKDSRVEKGLISQQEKRVRKSGSHVRGSRAISDHDGASKPHLPVPDPELDGRKGEEENKRGQRGVWLRPLASPAIPEAFRRQLRTSVFTHLDRLDPLESSMLLP